MSKLAKTEATLLGLAALGTFVAALGGPNVFSTFSNVLSTIRPKSEIALQATKEKETQDKVPTKPEPEEKKELAAEKIEEVKQEVAVTPQEISKPVEAITQETQTKEQTQVISPVTTPTPANSSILGSQPPRGSETPSWKKKYQASMKAKDGDSEGTGIWSGFSGGSFMLKKAGEKCAGLTFDGKELKLEENK